MRMMMKMEKWPCGIKAMRRWYRERQTIVALSGLDDAMLKDIGLNRGGLLRVARDIDPD